tara:strand:- start:40849 stop:41307 length:459 start_codon:yes stop_codon:yes gene_type:complete
MTNNKTKQSGFTLLEVLITLVILAIGLLGLAGMQATGLKNNHSAYMRSQATQFAYDIADRMRANTIAIASYITSDPSTASAQASCMAAGCTPAQMAGNDLFEWNSALTSTLPLAEATISVATGVYTITINWDDNRDGLVDSDDPDFQVSFEL